MWCNSFHLDFKNLNGFAFAIWKSIEPAHYIDSTKIPSFKDTELIWKLPVSMETKSEILDYLKISDAYFIGASQSS